MEGHGSCWAAVEVQVPGQMLLLAAGREGSSEDAACTCLEGMVPITAYRLQRCRVGCNEVNLHLAAALGGFL